MGEFRRKNDPDYAHKQGWREKTDDGTEDPGYTDRKLRARVMYLNKEGGFNNTIHFARVKDASVGLRTREIMPILMDLHMKKDSVTDPTTWICNAFYKKVAELREAISKGVPIPAHPERSTPTDEVDKKLRGRIMWMNKEGGAKESLHYLMIKEAAIGLTDAQIKAVFTELQDRIHEIKEPNAFVCAALKKYKEWASGALQIEEPSTSAKDTTTTGAEEWMSPQEWMNMMFAEVARQTTAQKQLEEAKAAEAQKDWKLRVRLMWLNNEGGFANKINYRKVFAASSGLSTETIMEILKSLQDHKDEIPDPTEYIVALMHASGGGQVLAMQPQQQPAMLALPAMPSNPALPLDLAVAGWPGNPADLSTAQALLAQFQAGTPDLSAAQAFLAQAQAGQMPPGYSPAAVGANMRVQPY